MKSTVEKLREDARILRALASRLDAGEPPLTAEERSLLRRTLRKLLQRSEAELKQLAAAQAYRLLLEIEGKKRWKEHRNRVAVHFGYKDQAVSDAATKYKREVGGWLARLEQTVEYDPPLGPLNEPQPPQEPLTRVEMLKRELKSILNC